MKPPLMSDEAIEEVHRISEARSQETEPKNDPYTIQRIFFLVAFGNIKYFTWALDREDAKRNAHSWIGGNADDYVVEPLTNKGDRVKLDLILYI